MRSKSHLRHYNSHYYTMELCPRQFLFVKKLYAKRLYAKGLYAKGLYVCCYMPAVICQYENVSDDSSPDSSPSVCSRRQALGAFSFNASIPSSSSRS